LGDAVPDGEFHQLVFGLIVDLFRSRAALEAEIVVLRQQITVLCRGDKSSRLPFMAADRWYWLGLPAVYKRLAFPIRRSPGPLGNQVMGQRNMVNPKSPRTTQREYRRIICNWLD